MTADRGNTFSPRGYWHFANNNRAFQKFGGSRVRTLPFSLTGDGSPVQVNVGLMTLGAFEVLGVFPEHGRLPTPEEDAPRGPSVALLSHELWVGQFGAAPSILGRIIQLNGLPREVIGVMPAAYDFPTPDADAWIPLQLDPASGNFGGHYITAIARLKPGITIEAAADDARSLVARFDEAGYGPSWLKNIFDGDAIVRPLQEEIAGNAREPLLIVFGTVGFVLLIACGNVANLLLVRAEGRRQENAVRLALGSSRSRLVRQMLVESAVLALMGGAAGVLLAYAGIRALVSIGPAGIPRLDEIGINGAALAFAALVSVLAGMLFGVLPALRASSAGVTAALRDRSRSATVGRARHRTRNALVMAQVALAFVLVISCRADGPQLPGAAVDRPRVLRRWGIDVRGAAAADEICETRGRGAILRPPDRAAGSRSGVIRAGAVDTLPLTGSCNNFAAVIEEFPPAQEDLPPVFAVRRTTPGYSMR